MLQKLDPMWALAQKVAITARASKWNSNAKATSTM